MKAGAFIQRDFPVAGPFDSLSSVSDRLAESRYLVVMEDDRFVGLLTPADVLQHPHKLVVDCITDKPRVEVDADLDQVLVLMRRGSLQALPVFDGQAFAGVITGRGLLSALQSRIASDEMSADDLELLSLSVAGIAHDFSNILTAIFGHMMEITDRPLDAAHVREEMERMDRHLSLASELVKQLQAFSSSGSPIRGTVRDPAELLRQSVEFFLRGSKVELELELAPDLGGLGVDRGHLSRVIGNLVMNARQAMDERGVLRVAADNWLAGDDDGMGPGRYVKVTLTDSGPGIPAEAIEKVFEPRYTTKPRGSGLGLAIVRALVDEMGGVVRLRSTPGEGTTAELLLPAAQAD